MFRNHDSGNFYIIFIHNIYTRFLCGVSIIFTNARKNALVPEN